VEIVDLVFFFRGSVELARDFEECASTAQKSNPHQEGSNWAGRELKRGGGGTVRLKSWGEEKLEYYFIRGRHLRGTNPTALASDRSREIGVLKEKLQDSLNGKRRNSSSAKKYGDHSRKTVPHI